MVQQKHQNENCFEDTSADSWVSFIINKSFIIFLQKGIAPAIVEDYVISSCSRQYSNFEQLFRIT